MSVERYKCVIDCKAGEWLTKGNIYEVIDGNLTYDDGWVSHNVRMTNKLGSMRLNEMLVKVEEDNKVEELKIGDRVVVNGFINGVKFNNEIGKMIGTEIYNGLYIGVEFTRKISEINSKEEGHTCFSKGKDGYCWWVNRDMVTKLPSNTQSIHITVSDTTTHAVLKDDDKVVKRATAKLCPTDTFDFQTGAKLAFDRLFDKVIVEDKPKFVKAKIGDTIKIVKDDAFHCPPVKIGDEGIVVNVGNDYIETRINGFFDSKEEYIIVSSKPKLITDYSADELLSELKRRING